ncbi:hypothetical protein [Xanthobacter agilis]|uniref:Capsule polysaccharide biosynthesis protein n=1 Tax=Xanthobacter agilis TaxID=47492 RepID=A0ABU0LBX2_XANAG|nr:hypothetical protein [Xanthobacter agilis]MDQ0504611.1 hypothetical protein [Xanthobacter agilis]
MERPSPDTEYVTTPDGIGILRANYMPRKDFIEVRGGCPKALGVAFVEVALQGGEVLGRTPCKPPSSEYPPDYPPFMQGTDWFAVRRGRVFGAEQREPPALLVRFLDAEDREIAQLQTPTRIINTPAAPPTAVASPSGGSKDYHISIDQFFFERHWNLMSIRGAFFSVNGTQAVEVWADKEKVGDAQLGMHRPLSKRTPDPANGFALETTIDVDLLKYERIHLRCVDKAGKVYRRSLPAGHLERSDDGTTLFYNKRHNDLLAKAERQKRVIPRWRERIVNFAMQCDLGRALGPSFARRATDDPDRVLLFVNNVNPGGRPEKWQYFLKLHEELEKFGFELVLAQQSAAASPADPPMWFIRMSDMRTWLKPAWSRELRKTGRTDTEYRAMLHEASSLDYGYEQNKRNVLPTWLESYSSSLQIARAADQVLTMVRPKVALLWHEWNQASHICKWLCDAYGVPTLYCHDGALPMTMGMDPVGEMAESTPVAKAEEYYARPLARADFRRAITYRRLVRDTGLNRKSTVADGSLSRLLDKVRAEGKKVLFYAGCNDWQTGMLPVWWDKSSVHSPIFIDSYDAFRYLSDLCAQRGDWVLLFKPHPHLEPQRVDLSEPHVIFVREANIHECVRQSDVCLTLVSATAYMSLFNDRPTILLGRNSLSRSGSCYEPHEIGDIPEMIEAALRGVDVRAMKRRWIDHLARMIRYTLQPMHPDSEKLMGKPYSATARFIIKEAKSSPVLHNG